MINSNEDGIIPDMNNQPEADLSQPLIKYGWLRVVLFLIAGYGFMIAFSVIGELIVFNLTGITVEEVKNSTVGYIQTIGPFRGLIMRGTGFIGLLLAVWIFRKFIDKKSLKSLGFEFRDYAGDFIQGLVWGVAVITIGFMFLYLVNGISVVKIQFDPVSFLGYLLVMIVVALNEEIMVRGYILNNLFTSMNRYTALTVSSLFFALMHLMNAGYSWISFLNIFLAGIFLGIYYVHKQNLWFPIGLHFTWNLFQGPVFGFEVSGHKLPGIFAIEKTGNVWLTGGEFGFEASLPATILIIAASIIIHFRFRKK